MAPPFINPLTGNHQSGSGSSSSGGAGGGGASRGGKAPRAGGLAGSALKRAGLVDEDSGMRDASGPSRRSGRAPQSTGGGARAAQAGASASANNKGRESSRTAARDRANPMARPSRSAPSSSSNAAGNRMPTGVVFGIRGAAAAAAGSSGKGKGRQPGGDAASGPSMNSRTTGTLRKFLASRWNKDARYLNLDSMSTDPILEAANVRPPGVSGATKDLGTVMWKLCAELFPECVTISLANNNLKTLVPIGTLPQYLPHLQNLSLESNDLKWTKDLTWYASSKQKTTPRFTSLAELILIANPMQSNAKAAGNEAGYRSEVLGKFPTLRILDREAVSDAEREEAKRAKAQDQGATAAHAGVATRNFPCAMQPGFTDDASKTAVPVFLQKFFTLFDTQRSQLRPVYTTNASFSFVTIQQVPPRARAAGYVNSSALPRQRDLSWRGYTSGVASHNLMQLGARPANKGFPRGANAIVATLLKLPHTTHPLSDASKFLVDSWVVPNAVVGAATGDTAVQGQPTPPQPEALLFISVHGQFQEAPSQGLRSFSRTFVVAPTVPGSAAEQAGWPCVIISEQFTIRHYLGQTAWAADALPVENAGAASASASTSAQPNGVPTPVLAVPTPAQAGVGELPAYLKGVQPAAGLTEQQHALSLQLAAQTGLTYPFAVQCLAQNGWDAQVAYTNFLSLKANIPPEAFAVQGLV